MRIGIAIQINPALIESTLQKSMTQILPPTALSNCYFFTIRLAEGMDNLLLEHISTLRAAMRYTLQHHPMHIDAMAVLPSIIYAVWTLPKGDTDYPNRIGMLKARFSRSMDVPSHRSLDQIQRGDKGIWERRYCGHRISDQEDFNKHRELVHLSPVNAGLCATPQDWPYSSVHRDITCASPRPLLPKNKDRPFSKSSELQPALHFS